MTTSLVTLPKIKLSWNFFINPFNYFAKFSMQYLLIFVKGFLQEFFRQFLQELLQKFLQIFLLHVSRCYRWFYLNFFMWYEILQGFLQKLLNKILIGTFQVSCSTLSDIVPPSTYIRKTSPMLLLVKLAKIWSTCSSRVHELLHSNTFLGDYLRVSQFFSCNFDTDFYESPQDSASDFSLGHFVRTFFWECLVSLLQVSLLVLMYVYFTIFSSNLISIISGICSNYPRIQSDCF